MNSFITYKDGLKMRLYMNGTYEVLPCRVELTNSEISPLVKNGIMEMDEILDSMNNPNPSYNFNQYTSLKTITIETDSYPLVNIRNVQQIFDFCKQRGIILIWGHLYNLFDRNGNYTDMNLRIYVRRLLLRSFAYAWTDMTQNDYERDDVVKSLLPRIRRCLRAFPNILA